MEDEPIRAGEPRRAIGRCWRKYFSFSGRATRAEFWWWQLFYYVSIFVLSCVAWVEPSRFCGWATLCGVLMLQPPSVAVAVRRFHDTGRGFWKWLFYVVPTLWGAMLLDLGLAEDSSGGIPFAGVAILLGFLLLVCFGVRLFWHVCRPSDKGENKYGQGAF